MEMHIPNINVYIYGPKNSYINNVINILKCKKCNSYNKSMIYLFMVTLYLKVSFI